MVFEIYRPRSSNQNRVALTKHHIRLGNELARKIDSDQVEIAFDKENKVLRIRAVNEGGMKLSNNKIGARGVFRYFGLEKVRGSFKAEYDENEKAIYVYLE